MIQDPAEPWTVSHCSSLELGADGLTKPLQGQAFTRFLSPIGMMDEADANISKVVGPSSSISPMATNGFSKALTGVGAAVMGVGAITESEVLVLGGLALAAVSLYRQRYGAGSAPGEQELHPEQGLLPGGDEFAEESKSQPEKSSKDQITRV